MKDFKQTAYGYVKAMFAKNNMYRRVVISIVSIITMGFGISLFSVSGFGVDPFTYMNMSISTAMGIGYGTYQMIINFIILLYVTIAAHRGLIGVGTVFNMIGVGYTCEFFQNLLSPLIKENSMAIRILILLSGLIILCFACSLFFTADIGVGPYDALGFMLSRELKISYKWVRVITDLLVITIGLFSSGCISRIINGDLSSIKNIGAGTVITAFCMGPLINFFNKSVSSKILAVDYEKLCKKTAVFMLNGAMKKNAALKTVLSISNKTYKAA